MEVKFGWVNFSPNDLCKAVPMRNVSIPFHLGSATRKTDHWLMWVLSATHFAMVVGEEWRRSLIGLDLALLLRCMCQTAGTATPARQTACLLDDPDPWPSACEGRQLSRTHPSRCSDITVPTSYRMKAAVPGCKPPPLRSRRPHDHNPIASLPWCCLHSTSM